MIHKKPMPITTTDRLAPFTTSIALRKSRSWLFLAVCALAACAPSNRETPAESRSVADALLGNEYTGTLAPTPRGQDGKPVLTGYWKLLHESGKPDGNLAKDLPGFTLPYSERGRAALNFNVTETIDPEARCIITGIPRLLTSVLPFEILQTPERLGTFHYLGWHRWVWLDGRSADEDPDPRYLGNAIGSWDGDTLVITSTGFKDSSEGRLWLDDNANPQSSQALIVERWTRPDFHHLNLELTYTDPVYYTQPIVYRRSWVHGAEDEGLTEFSCEWNTPWIVEHLEPGPGKIGPDGNRGYGDNQLLPDLPLGSVDSSRGTGYWLYRKNKPKPSDLPAQ